MKRTSRLHVPAHQALSLGILLAGGCAASDASRSSFEAPTEIAPDQAVPGFGRTVTPDAPRATPPRATCGNSAKDMSEECDDGNAQGGDGCSATCTVEPAFSCPVLGAACRAAACGDGFAVAEEECDDGNARAGDGCTEACTLEPGYACGTPNQPCAKTTCGDGRREGTEQCDDGNVRPYDGCSAACTLEPTCAGGACASICGDGFKLGSEACDDGNVRNGDGCSATCTREPGFECEVLSEAAPETLDVPIVYRDFTPQHPDFEAFTGDGKTTGLVASRLGADGFPMFQSATGESGSRRQLSGPEAFKQWWSDDPAVSKTISNQVLRLQKQRDGAYVFDSPAFFPIDGLGWGNFQNGHNFHFTSELRYYFTFQGGENLVFRGDDDVWVFLNGRLAVDLGGLHPPTEGAVTLDAAFATAFGLTAGSVYEVDVFQAERHTDRSNYRLTLRGFAKERTRCRPTCGDGIKTRFEACDDGSNLGGYGRCNPGCLLGARCGDGVIQRDAGEACDDGNKSGGDGCSATCQNEQVVPR